MVFRPSWLWMALGTVVCLLFAATGVVFLVMPRGPGPVFAGVWIALGMLIAVLLLRRTLRALAPDTWLMRYNARVMLIKIAPIWRRDAAGACVAELSRDEIEWVRAYRRTTITHEPGGDVRVRRTFRFRGYLEIKLRGGDLKDLRACIATAGAPGAQYGCTTSGGVPVSVTDEGLVRLQWYGPESVVAPSLKKTITLLGKGLPVHDAVSQTDDFTKATADKQKMQQHIIELVAEGQVIPAITLARHCYGYSLTEAHQFVEDLRRVGKPLPASPANQARGLP
jgi:hypothetical protein